MAVLLHFWFAGAVGLLLGSTLKNMCERLSPLAASSLRHALVASALLLVGCGGDDVGPGALPFEGGHELSFTVVPTAELAANGGTVHVAFVAYQDGDGPWLPMAQDGERYRAIIESDTFGVALGCAPHVLPGTALTAAFVRVQHAAVTDGTSLSDFSCVELLRPKRLSGTATGLPTPTSIFRLGTGEGVTNANVRADGFSVNVYSAPTDVIGYYDGGSPAASKVVRLSKVDPNQAGPLALDFSAAPALVTHPVTSSTNGVPLLVSSHLRTAAGGRFLQLWAPQNQLSYATVPKALLAPGDLIRVGITASSAGGSDESFVYLAEPAATALDLGPVVASASPLLEGGRATFSFFLPDDRLAFVDHKLTISARVGNALSWQTSTVTQGWLETTGAKRYQLPDLSGLPGWTAEMKLPTGVPVTWETVRHEQSGKSPVAGYRSRLSTRSGTLAN